MSRLDSRTVLHVAKRLLRETRWTRKIFGTLRGLRQPTRLEIIAATRSQIASVCLVGALCYASGRLCPNAKAACRYINLALQDRGFPKGYPLDRWNDRDARSKQDVLKLLDEAIRLAESRKA